MSSIQGVFTPYIDHFITFVQGFSTIQLVLLVLVNIPILVVAVNVLLQLVSWAERYTQEMAANTHLYQLPQDRSLPPVVFHYIPWFGSAASYGNDPVKFFFESQEKVTHAFFEQSKRTRF